LRRTQGGTLPERVRGGPLKETLVAFTKKKKSPLLEGKKTAKGRDRRGECSGLYFPEGKEKGFRKKKEVLEKVFVCHRTKKKHQKGPRSVKWKTPPQIEEGENSSSFRGEVVVGEDWLKIWKKGRTSSRKRIYFGNSLRVGGERKR